MGICWSRTIPPGPELRRDLETYLRLYSYDRVHHGRFTAGEIPADNRRRCPQDGATVTPLSAHVGVRPTWAWQSTAPNGHTTPSCSYDDTWRNVWRR
jgi:hypothetical protein